MTRIAHLFLVWLLLAGGMEVGVASVETYATKVSSLVDPAKLATMRERGAQREKAMGSNPYC